MRLEVTQESANPVADAYRAHLEQSVREEGCRQAGAVSFSVTITPEGNATKVVIDRETPVQLPGPAAKVVGGSIRIVQTELWHAPDADDVSRADITVEFPGKPISMQADARIEPHDGGSLETVTGDIKVKVPMVGKVIEPEIAKQIRRSLRIELASGVEWLAAGN